MSRTESNLESYHSSNILRESMISRLRYDAGCILDYWIWTDNQGSNKSVSELTIEKGRGSAGSIEWH